ncbi:27587_t:CDS:2 [Dentiscutata erythropus]|uniref:27587_t:CDS:1 n=1 Tax=Dentiscutata erythropus TaxID=1348616 RepID=A0A9N8WDV1_9GLOM|nr:27587_t:CDS:2 [Dentiscutata erythropus]
MNTDQYRDIDEDPSDIKNKTSNTCVTKNCSRTEDGTGLDHNCCLSSF